MTERAATGCGSRQDSLDVLTQGELTVEGRLTDASNTTLRCVATLGDQRVRCVYKPVAGERPLWDFPDGTLAGREVGAYLIATAMQWPLVPPTVYRDGPLGVGACQLWIEESDEALVGFVPDGKLPAGWHPIAAARDDEGNAFTLAHADDPRLARMAVLDVVINNADRKGGHLLVAEDGQLYGVDHGVCLHQEPKLRTVLWGWAGQPVPAEAEPALARLAEQLDGALGDELAGHLTAAEVVALRARVAQLQAERRFPQPSPAWPTMPWPPI